MHPQRRRELQQARATAMMSGTVRVARIDYATLPLLRRDPVVRRVVLWGRGHGGLTTH
jgi:hypothetical protein